MPNVQYFSIEAQLTYNNHSIRIKWSLYDYLISLLWSLNEIVSIVLRGVACEKNPVDGRVLGGVA